MSNEEFWGAEIDVRADDSAQIPPSDDEAEDNATLVNPFDVIRNPSYRICNAGIDSKGSQECPGVFNGRPLRAQKHRETSDADEGDADVAEAATFRSIRDESDRDGLER